MFTSFCFSDTFLSGMKKQQTLHFQRFEMKYVLTVDQAARVRDSLEKYLIPDPFAVASGGVYEVMSLYFDSPLFCYYEEKKEGTMMRKKVRLRTYRYGNELANATFLEIKRKQNVVILKDRCPVTRDEAIKLCQGGALSLEGDKQRQVIAEEFARERAFKSISPKLLVAYDREPYIGKFSANLRLTFDRNIRVLPTQDLYTEEKSFLPLNFNQVVLEIKFTGTLPHYIRQIIEQFELERVSFSKYCYGIDRTGLRSMRAFPYRGYHDEFAHNLYNQSYILNHL